MYFVFINQLHISPFVTMILQQLQLYHISMFVLSSSTSGYISKHHLHAYAFVIGITMLSAQHCSQGIQVSILAKAETFECRHEKYTGKEFLSQIWLFVYLLSPYNMVFPLFVPHFKSLLINTDIFKEICLSISSFLFMLFGWCLSISSFLFMLFGWCLSISSFLFMLFGCSWISLTGRKIKNCRKPSHA